MLNDQSLLPSFQILGMKVNVVNYAEAVAKILQWAQARESRYVCAANVHMVMEAYDSQEFRSSVNRADLVTSDGMPLVWILRREVSPEASRVYGPDLTLHCLEAAEKAGLPVGFFGGRPDVLKALKKKLSQRFPRLKIVYEYAPPFRPLTDEENNEVLKEVSSSGARILFVGLGCPKQETWMANNARKIEVVMLGVGAAFDLLSGTVKQAPRWMMASGLEWLFRFTQEPRRLWNRYLKHNPRFVVKAMLAPPLTRYLKFRGNNGEGAGDPKSL